MTDPRQALFVMPSSLIGGAERVAFNLVIFLLSRGWHVSLVTMSYGRKPGWDQLESHPNFRWTALSVKSEKLGILKTIRTVSNLSRRHCFSLAYSTHVHVNAMLSILRHTRLLRTRALVARESTVIFMRKTNYPRLLFHLLYRLYGGIDVLICQTSSMKSHLLEAVPHLRRMAVEVVPNPVNVDFIKQCVARGDGDADGILIDFVFCGRLISLKRPELVIRALALLETDCWRSAQFLGHGEVRELRALAGELGIADRIVFRGGIDNPYAVFARARVGVLTSTIEGFPNVLLEMMAAGTGRLVSSLCTPAILDLPGIDIVDPIDEERLATALKAALTGAARTSEFRAYIENERSISLFWDRIRETLAARHCGAAH
jgi:glycosyltransferase involved in cell wall biosynthesis